MSDFWKKFWGGFFGSCCAIVFALTVWQVGKWMTEGARAQMCIAYSKTIEDARACASPR